MQIHNKTKNWNKDYKFVHQYGVYDNSKVIILYEYLTHSATLIIIYTNSTFGKSSVYVPRFFHNSMTGVVSSWQHLRIHKVSFWHWSEKEQSWWKGHRESSQSCTQNWLAEKSSVLNRINARTCTHKKNNVLKSHPNNTSF